MTTNIFWDQGDIARDERAKLIGHKGVTLWLTGLSGSGKSTVASGLERKLLERGIHSYRLDGDNVRHGLNKDLGFSPDHRTENIRRISEVAKLFNDSGIVTITSFISPYIADRELAKSIHFKENLSFYEIYIDAPLEVVESRDPKGLYKKARAGLIKEFTGISAPYEAPTKPDLHIQTHNQPPEASVQAILDFLDSIKLLDPVIITR